MLERQGHRVDTADSGECAIEMLERTDPRPDLALIDLTMPGLDGVACAAQIQQRWPEMRVLIASGFSKQELSDHLAGDDSLPFIHKPFSMSQLREALTEVLAPSADDALERQETTDP